MGGTDNDVDMTSNQVSKCADRYKEAVALAKSKEDDQLAGVWNLYLHEIPFKGIEREFLDVPAPLNVRRRFAAELEKIDPTLQVRSDSFGLRIWQRETRFDARSSIDDAAYCKFAEDMFAKGVTPMLGSYLLWKFHYIHMTARDLLWVRDPKSNVFFLRHGFVDVDHRTQYPSVPLVLPCWHIEQSHHLFSKLYTGYTFCMDLPTDAQIREYDINGCLANLDRQHSPADDYEMVKSPQQDDAPVAAVAATGAIPQPASVKDFPNGRSLSLSDIVPATTAPAPTATPAPAVPDPVPVVNATASGSLTISVTSDGNRTYIHTPAPAVDATTTTNPPLMVTTHSDGNRNTVITNYPVNTVNATATAAAVATTEPVAAAVEPAVKPVDFAHKVGDLVWYREPTNRLVVCSVVEPPSSGYDLKVCLQAGIRGASVPGSSSFPVTRDLILPLADALPKEQVHRFQGIDDHQVQLFGAIIHEYIRCPMTLEVCPAPKFRLSFHRKDKLEKCYGVKEVRPTDLLHALYFGPDNLIVTLHSDHSKLAAADPAPFFDATVAVATFPYKLGDYVKVSDTVMKRYVAKIINVDTTAAVVRVHYLGWTTRYDEDISLARSGSRISPTPVCIDPSQIDVYVGRAEYRDTLLAILAVNHQNDLQQVSNFAGCFIVTGADGCVDHYGGMSRRYAECTEGLAYLKLKSGASISVTQAPIRGCTLSFDPIIALL